MKKGDYTYIVVYIVLASIGTLFSTHLFDQHKLMIDFYVYYTNLSNYFCLIVMCIALRQLAKLGTKQSAIKPYTCGALTLAIKGAALGIIQSPAVCCDAPKAESISKHITNPKRKQKTYHNYLALPQYLNGLMVLASQLIFITFCVYNFLLADFSFAGYWTNAYNLLFHVILPIMFIGFVVARCRLPNFWWLILPTIVQFGYVLVIYLRSFLVSGVSGRIVYPYFFLNFATLGAKTSFKWLGFMLVISISATLLICGLIVLNNKVIKKLISNKNK